MTRWQNRGNAIALGGLFDGDACRNRGHQEQAAPGLREHIGLRRAFERERFASIDDVEQDVIVLPFQRHFRDAGSVARNVA